MFQLERLFQPLSGSWAIKSRSVIDREPPRGKGSLDKAKERRNRHLEYEKIEEGKRSVRVAKIYHLPSGACN